MNSSGTSLILCVLHSRIIRTMNSSTRHSPSFLQISVEPSSSVNSLVLLRNIVSLMLYNKEWMVNGTVLLPFPCWVIPQILSPFRTWTIMILWMPPKFQTMFQWIQIKASRVLCKIPSVLSLTVPYQYWSSCFGTAQSKFHSNHGQYFSINPFFEWIQWEYQPPSDTTMGNDPSFPSVIYDISSVPKNMNHHLFSESNPSNGLGIAATNIAATNHVDDDVSTWHGFGFDSPGQAAESWT